MNEQAIRNALDDLEVVAKLCENESATEYEAEVTRECIESIAYEAGVTGVER